MSNHQSTGSNSKSTRLQVYTTCSVTEVYLDLLHNQLLCVVHLLWGPLDDELPEVGLSVGPRRLRGGDPHRRPCLLTDGLDGLSSFPDHRTTLVIRDEDEPRAGLTRDTGGHFCCSLGKEIQEPLVLALCPALYVIFTLL